VVTGFVALFALPAGRVAPRTHRVTLDGTDGVALLAALLEEILFLADAHDEVPVGVRVGDAGDTVVVELVTVPLADVTPTGPAPKGVSRSGLALAPQGPVWVARALVDI
jgi:SHS2 domain-containing protein